MLKGDKSHIAEKMQDALNSMLDVQNSMFDVRCSMSGNAGPFGDLGFDSLEFPLWNLGFVFWNFFFRILSK
jgi:hypothetical protein